MLYDDFSDLRTARRSQDVLIDRYIDGLSDDDLNRSIRYRTVVNPQTIEQALAPAWIISSITRPTTAARPMAC
jgi:hypothetical protein